MQRFESQIDQFGQLGRVAVVLGAVLTLCWLAGCGSGVGPATQTATTTPSPSVQTYFAPYVDQTSSPEPTPLTYTLDDVGKAFSRTSYAVLTPPGPYVVDAGSLTIGQRGLESLDITIANGTPVVQNSSGPSSFAVELAGQAGGFVQLASQPGVPLVAATQCPSFSSVQTYQFVTIPALLSYQINPGLPGQPATYQPTDTWNPITDTAYGSVDIVSSGSTVTFQNIQQYRLPSEVAADGKGPSPAQTPSSSVTGACGPTFFGNITNVPGTLVVTDPGSGQSNPPQAHIGIGPTGLLVEDNGHSPTTQSGFLANTAPALQYNNVLGAGTGAVGLPKPSGALDTSALTGAQYLGFIYAARSGAVTWSSNLASFGGVSSVPSGCPSVVAGASNPIYGGDFPTNDPTGSSNGGFGNSDFAIYLNQQDSSNNGLYSQATVCVGGPYAGNSTHVTYSFQAVAIAGQLGGKYAIFLIGLDSIQPWSIYLLQSN